MRKVLGFLALVTGLAFAQTSLKVGVILPPVRGFGGFG